ncbi:MAG: hemerythrin domain-containing protein [Pirellulaceae bacterium]
MNEDDDCRTYVEHLRLEHSHINHSLEELQQLLANESQWNKEIPTPALPARLIQLRELLVHHFREEEEGGCLEEAQSRSPNLSAGVRTLLAEHASLLSALDRMIAKAEVLAGQPGYLHILQVEFRGLLQQLHAHEAEENRILLFGFGSPAMDALST